MSTFADALGVRFLHLLEKTVNSPNRPIISEKFFIKNYISDDSELIAHTLESRLLANL